MSASFLPSSSDLDAGRGPNWGCQMQNLLGKSHHFQPSNGLKSGILGSSEGGVVEVELGLEGEDVLVELAVAEDFGVKPPVVKVPYSPAEFLVLNGCPLKGLPNPEGKNFWWVEGFVDRGSIDLLDIGEVPCAVVLAVPCDSSVIELFDPFGQDIGPFSKGDSERGEPIISDIPIQSFDKGLLIVKEMRLGELEVFLQLVNRSLVFFILGPDLALILLMTAVQSFDEGINNGVEHRWIQIGGGDSIADQF